MTTETTTKKTVEFRAVPPSEADEQKAFFDTAHTFLLPDHPEIHPLMFATLNGIPLMGSARQRSAIINKMKATGMVPGTPDVLFLSARGGYFGLVMEFKTVDRRNEKDGGLSEAQQEFMYQARLEGLKTAVAYGADDGLDTLKEYLDRPTTQDMIWKALRFAEKGDLEKCKLLLKEITLAWE